MGEMLSGRQEAVDRHRYCLSRCTVIQDAEPHAVEQVRSHESTTAGIRLRHKVLYGMGYLSVALATDMTLTWLLKRYYPDSSGVTATASVSAAAS